MTKMTWIMIAISIVVALTVVVCLFPPVSIVTDKAQEVVSISVTFEPEGEGLLETYYDDTAQEIYRLVAKTQAKARRYPHHLQAQTSTPKFRIEIFYQSGESDEIYSAENPEFIYRFLSTKGRDGDKGYVYSTNKELSAYIASLQG